MKEMQSSLWIETRIANGEITLEFNGDFRSPVRNELINEDIEMT